TYDIKTPAGTLTYSGKGWRVAFPVVDTGTCPPGDLGGQNFTIKGFSYLVVTQFVDDKGFCAVTNDQPGSPWAPYCLPAGAPTGTQTSGIPPTQRGTLFGYYQCIRVPLASLPPASGQINTGI